MLFFHQIFTPPYSILKPLSINLILHFIHRLSISFSVILTFKSVLMLWVSTSPQLKINSKNYSEWTVFFYCIRSWMAKSYTLKFFYKLKAHSSKQKTQPGTRQPITPYNRRLWTLLALGNVCLYIIFRGKTVKNSEAHKTNFSTHSRVFYKKTLSVIKGPKNVN